MKINRFMIAAPKSGSGKTMITCALLQLLKDSGKNVLSYKCGPGIVMMYLLSSNRDVAFAVAVILLGLFSGTIEFFALFMLIPLRYYNGKRGISLKYIFYAFYPVHLFVLYLICRLAMAAAVHT